MNALYLDVIVVREEHGETIDAQPKATSRGQAVLQSRAEVLIHVHGFVVTSGLVLTKQSKSSESFSPNVEKGEKKNTKPNNAIVFVSLSNLGKRVNLNTKHAFFL